MNYSIDEFRTSTKSMISEDRRDRLRSFLRSSPKMIILTLLIIAAITGYLKLRSIKAAHPPVEVAPIVAAVTVEKIPIILAHDTAKNDIVFPEVSAGNVYEIKDSQMKLWNAIFNDPKNAKVCAANIQGFIKKISGSTLSNKELVNRILESTETGTLNLIN
jgi:hypothetical protein